MYKYCIHFDEDQLDNSSNISKLIFKCRSLNLCNFITLPKLLEHSFLQMFHLFKVRF